MINILLINKRTIIYTERDTQSLNTTSTTLHRSDHRNNEIIIQYLHYIAVDGMIVLDNNTTQLLHFPLPVKKTRISMGMSASGLTATEYCSIFVNIVRIDPVLNMPEPTCLPTDNRFSVLDMKVALWIIFQHNIKNTHKWRKKFTFNRQMEVNLVHWWNTLKAPTGQCYMQLRAREDGKTHSTYLYSLVFSCKKNKQKKNYLKCDEQHLHVHM